MNQSVDAILRRTLSPWRAPQSLEDYLEKCRGSFLALDEGARGVVVREARRAIADSRQYPPVFFGENKQATVAFFAAGHRDRLTEDTRKAVAEILSDCPFAPWKKLADTVGVTQL